MKAKFTGTCMACRQTMQVGSEIDRMKGKWVHRACKDRSMNRKPAEAKVTYLPDARGTADRPQVTGIKASRQASISRTRQLS